MRVLVVVLFLFFFEKEIIHQILHAIILGGWRRGAWMALTEK